MLLNDIQKNFTLALHFTGTLVFSCSQILTSFITSNAIFCANSASLSCMV